MRADRKWIERNLGYDPIAGPPPDTAYPFPQAVRKGAAPEDYHREIIDFNSDSPACLQFLAFTTATGLDGLAPKTGSEPSGAPRADVLLVTWTVDERHPLSPVLTPGKDSHNDYFSYTHNFSAFRRKCGRVARRRSVWGPIGRRRSANDRSSWQQAAFAAQIYKCFGRWTVQRDHVLCQHPGGVVHSMSEGAQ